MFGLKHQIDFEAIKAAHPLVPFLEAQGFELRRKGSSGEFVCLCPFHQEKTPSFTIYPDNHAYCYGCKWHGSVIDFVREWFGCRNIREAVQRLVGEPLPMRGGGPVGNSTRPEKRAPYRLNHVDLRRMPKAARLLAGDQDLIHRLVTERPEWTPEAIRGAALDGDLGFEDGKLLFGYRHGIKARWTDPSGKRIIRWLCGGANGECWRQTLLLGSHRLIYFDEGETDALTLLSLEFEEPGKSLILALASASSLPEPKPFRGRTIVILTDPDTAGEQAAKKLRLSLEPVAVSVVTISLREIIHG
jgi:CHC2 zinc finger